MRAGWQRTPERITLANLRRRLQIGQQELATELGKSAAAAHKAEHSADPQLSTVTSYVEALGRLTNQETTVSVHVRHGKDTWLLDFPKRATDTAQRETSTEQRQHITKENTKMDNTDGDRARQIVASLDAELVASARRDIEDLVSRTRRAGRRQILVGHHAGIGEFFTAFARAGGRHIDGGVYYGGRGDEPGLWKALQELHRLDDKDTAMWNDLRREVVAQLVLDGTWQRIGASPRGSEFFVPDR